MPTPDQFDFACSADWRDFYDQRHGGDIDFPVSITHARHYRSIGLMPALPEDEPPEPSLHKGLVSIAKFVPKAKPKPTSPKQPLIKGVLR